MRWSGRAGPNRGPECVASPSVTAPSGPMAPSTEDRRETSLRLAAYASELRRAAKVAQQRASNFEAIAQALRTHGAACRTHADAARKRQNDR
jgi:hypothetical protein